MLGKMLEQGMLHIVKLDRSWHSLSTSLCVAMILYQDLTLISEKEHKHLLADDTLGTFMCTRENCSSKGLKALGELNNQVEKLHDTIWTPKACDYDPNKLYRRKSAWNMHKRSAHGTFFAQNCGYPNCTHDKTFTSLDSLYGHMKKKHS